jgi:hypothetical protein
MRHHRSRSFRDRSLSDDFSLLLRWLQAYSGGGVRRQEGTWRRIHLTLSRSSGRQPLRGCNGGLASRVQRLRRVGLQRGEGICFFVG